MRRVATAISAALLALVVYPSVVLASFAATGVAAEASPTRLLMSLVGLIVAFLLLLEALRVRKVALGGAIAERMSYVVLAIVCLAASALAQWLTNFVADVTQEQLRLATEALVITAMALLAGYFYSVRSALQSYLKSMKASTPPAQDESAEQNEEQ